LLITRNASKYKIKTHKGAQKRWIKNGSGTFKRGPSARNHGNAGWTQNLLAKKDRKVKAGTNGRHINRLK
ncbi:mitochondrial 54S ribosomal protein bL35m MRP35 ASCRUDRAFT_28674, partial [Ascoidea rubescens DSM 1968]